MLVNFSLKNFKSFREARLPLGPLTVLIGANAAGKSNAIEALRLLSWLAQGQKLSSIQYAVNSADRLVRGRVEDLCHRGELQFGMGCELADEGGFDRLGTSSLDLEIALRDGELHVVKEQLRDIFQQVPLYDLDKPSTGSRTDARVAYNNFARGGIKPHVTVSDQMAVFTQLDSPARFEAGHKRAQETIPVIVSRYQSLLANILFLDAVPARMREYSYTTERHLVGDGANLSSVLFHLWGGNEADPEAEPFATQRRAILAFIQSLPEQDIAGLDFLSGPRGEVMVRLLETFGGEPRPCDAALLSDGTLRVLAIAAAMLSAQEGSLVVIEEIDNGVHPSRARHLLDNIRGMAQARKLRVLLSTHNPALLDALPDEAVPDVVFCYRDPGTGASRIVRMQDLPDAPELLVQGPLGHLMTSGALDRFVKTHPGPGERRREAREWLQALRTAGSGTAL